MTITLNSVICKLQESNIKYSVARFNGIPVEVIAVIDGKKVAANEFDCTICGGSVQWFTLDTLNRMIDNALEA